MYRTMSSFFFYINLRYFFKYVRAFLVYQCLRPWTVPICKFSQACWIGLLLSLLCRAVFIPFRRKRKVKCLSMIQPGRTRQEVIILKSPIWLKLGRKIECHQHIHVLKHQVKIFHFTRVMGKTGKMAILAQIYAY